MHQNSCKRIRAIRECSRLLLALTVCLYMGSCDNTSNSLAEGGDAGYKVPDSVDFTFHVKPILSDRCFTCHGPDENALEGGLSLHTAEGAYKLLGEEQDHAAIVPGNVEKSVLVQRIYSQDPGQQMPPPESNLTLTNYEKDILKKWIAQGAEYKPHWAFVPPEKPLVPKVKSEWVKNEIDAFIYRELNSHNLKPSPPASREKLARRVYFDLTGLPPGPEELDAFLQDESPNAYEDLIDRLLSSGHYAENMAMEWMEISRYADTHGYQDDFERIMWPWRDWVIHAFGENMPYDEFVTYQLAGDLLPEAGLEGLLATGFNRNHKITFEGGVIPEEYRVEYVEDRTLTFGTAFLGLTMECARCHDHKYDPISQKNHFELFSFFNNVDERGLIPSPSEIPEPYITLTEKEVEGVLDFVRLDQSPVKEVPVMVMEEMKAPRQAYILDRGLYDQHTEEVFPNTPEDILPYPAELPPNRLGLAKWLFDERNPLTARVAVNRLWQRMFGTGIVASSFDFGNQGALPSHPELLDFLAIKFREEGWDMQKMLKYIALSATYRQDAAMSAELLEKDAANKWLARAPRLRLTAEQIRDQALKISGLLNTEVGGPSVKPYQPAGLWEETTGGGGGSTATYVPSTGKDLYRKSLYTFWKRTVPPPNMMTFDAASRDLCTVKRQETNTPLQALVLLHDPQLIEASRALADRAVRVAGSGLEQQVSYIFRSATSRIPDEIELGSLIGYHEQMMGNIEEGIINPGEYLGIGQYKASGEISPEKLTALALTAHAIMNLDETISKG